MKKQIHETTTNRRVYKYARLDSLNLLKCPKCGPHRGCNRFTKRKSLRSWKDTTKRGTQWK